MYYVSVLSDTAVDVQYDMRKLSKVVTLEIQAFLCTSSNRNLGVND